MDQVLDGYAIEAFVHHGARSDVYRATSLTTGDHVIIKLSAVDASSATARVRAQHEFAVGNPIDSPHVVHYVGVERQHDRVAIVEEAFGDRSLADLLASERLEIDAALQIGIGITTGLAEIHAHSVTHRAIHPGNIVVETGSRAVKLIDFAEASVLSETTEPVHGLDGSAVPLPYISPEQTGRMNRRVDHRTDFYSLGATLYHAFAGRPPFELADPLALVHAHIALPHRPLCELDPRIPQPISNIVDRLLAKNAEDRYQSARGIVADLERCLAQYQKTGAVASFPLGLHDTPESFQISDKLYGRTAERAVLIDAFQRVADGGKRLLLVTGYAGIGKSALVAEIHRPIVARRGLFVTGKFDQLKRHVPYSALGQALGELCRDVLTTTETELAQWRSRILDHIAGNASLIIDFVPELEWIVGPQPALPPTGLVESQHRFDVTLARFVSAFADASHPLVIFLDDLQWADPATLRVLGALLRAPKLSHLLVIGAYRDNEVGAAHPLTSAIDDMRRASIAVETLQLSGLSSDDVWALVADTVHAPRAEVRELADLVVEKTSGNPFFVNEFLRTLHDERLLRWSAERASWTWSLPEIEAQGIAPNVVELMVRKLQRLAPATQDALRLGAAIGNQFEIGLLAAASGEGVGEMRARLAPAIRERLVVPLDPHDPIGVVDEIDEEAEGINYRYRFLHDRVQQAAYESIPEASRPALHLGLGRIMLARTDPDTRGERIFKIVDHLALGKDLIADPVERIELAKLHLEAGTMARLTTAYGEGLAYLRDGIALLPADPWRAHYPLAYGLHLRCAECAYLAGKFDEADELSDALLPKLRTAVEQAELYSIRIVLEANRGKYDRAIELGRAALAALGNPVPPHTADALETMRAKAARAMEGRRVEDLAALPALADARIAAVVNVLSHLLPPAYFGDLDLFYWVVHENLCLAIEHGVSPASATGFTDYGMFLIAHEHDYERAFAFGELALALAARDEGLAVRAHVQLVFAVTMNAYSKHHTRTSIPLLERASELGLQTGDVLYMCYATVVLPEHRFILGEPIEDILRELDHCEGVLRAFQYADMILEIRMFRQCMRALRGETVARASLTTDDLAESAIVAEAHATPALQMRGEYFIYKTILLALFGEYREAVQTILASDDIIETSNAALFRLTQYAAFACVALVDGLRDPDLERSGIEAKLQQKRDLLARLATSAPVSYRHAHLLVEAELADFEGREHDATALYDDAIRDATANGYHHHAAFASERAARAALRRNHPRLARSHLLAARAGYARWGALGLVRALDETHPELAPRRAEAPAPPAFDLVSVVRASQALSTEISIPALLERMMREIVQASGAQRGVLLVESEGALRVEALLDLPHDRLEVLSGEAAEGTGVIAESLVRYTLRTGDDVVLAHAARTGPFTRDPYVIAHGSKSLLAMAVRHRDRVSGVLFLENELTTDAFPDERLEVLRLLVSQAAISLENARLYDAMNKLNVELLAKEALLRDFLDGIPVGIYVVDAEGRHTFLNRRATQIVGKQHDPTLALSDLAAYYGIYIAGTNELYPVGRGPLSRALQGQSSMVDDVEIHRGDRVVPLAVWGTPILGDDGKVRYAILAFQDIGPQRDAEAARAQLEEQLRQTEHLESIGRLAGGVAHDFNNLLTPILMLSDLATRAGGDPAPYLAQIHDAAEQAADLTKQLLAFGRRQVLDVRPLDLNQELRNFERMLRRLIPEDVEIELRLAPDLGLVSADQSQIQRIVMNLAMNAADAMATGGRLTLETASVAGVVDNAHRAPSGRWVVLRVVDTGHGIDKETLAKIFDPFFTTKPLGRGTGLGLPTVYGLVAQHGGHVLVHSEPGKGSTFEVFLPSVPRDHVNAVASASPSDTLATPSGHSEQVLVVEDDAAIRSVIVDVLSRDGYRVAATGSPTEAIEIARMLGADLRLLITDVVMPTMNGRELFAELERELPNLEALFISGYSDATISDHGLLDAGIELLPKPFSVDQLLHRVHDILAKQASI